MWRRCGRISDKSSCHVATIERVYFPLSGMVSKLVGTKAGEQIETSCWVEIGEEAPQRILATD